MRAHTEDMTMIPTAPPPLLDPRRHALFLDLDGTLVEIKERPRNVKADAALQALLSDLARAMNGALAIITGRTVSDAQRILNGAIANIAGVHGHELQRGAEVWRDTSAQKQIATARAQVGAALQQHTLAAMIEDKGASLALHYRHAPEGASHIREFAERIASQHGLCVLQGKMVVEIIGGARTKGDALETFMGAPPFAGRVPVKAGDDVTDEHGFEAARRLGGYGVLVGERRETSATYHLPRPGAVRAWLRATLEHAR